MVLSALLFLVGVGLVIWGAEWFTDGAVSTATLFRLSPFFVGTVISESLEETARMVAPARRGHPELAWGERGTHCGHPRRLQSRRYRPGGKESVEPAGKLVGALDVG